MPPLEKKYFAGMHGRKMKKDKKALMVSSHDISLDGDYIKWMCDIKQRFRAAQIKTAVKVNSEQLLFNWQLGRDLVLRRAEEKWGSGIVEQLSLDLQNEFPQAKGFSTTNLWYMKKWYLFYGSNPQKLQQAAAVFEAAKSAVKLHQIGADIREDAGKLQQLVGEIK